MWNGHSWERVIDENPKENPKWWVTLPFVSPYKDLTNVWTSLTKKNAKLHEKVTNECEFAIKCQRISVRLLITLIQELNAWIV